MKTHDSKPKTLPLLPLLGGLLALFVAPSLPAAEPPGAEIAGHYLAVGYYKAMEKTRSPIAAAAESDLVALLIDSTPEGYRLSVTSYHEGLNFLIRGVQITGDKVAVKVDSQDDDTEEITTLNIELKKTADGVTLASGALWGEEHITYRKLPGTVASFVNGLTLAGKYVDDKGKPYVFETNGDVVWAGRKVGYEIVLDPFEADCDYLIQNDPDQPDAMILFGFRRQNGKIGIYELVESNEMPIQCAKKPLATLTPKP